jgi:hypothetical protein
MTYFLTQINPKRFVMWTEKLAELRRLSKNRTKNIAFAKDF